MRLSAILAVVAQRTAPRPVASGRLEREDVKIMKVETRLHHCNASRARR
jgi:hypothetical protein